MNKEIDYIKEKLIILFKRIKEYRANFYVHLTSDFFNLVIVMSFYLVFKQISVGLISNWTIFDFFVFFLIINFSTKFRNCFYFWFFRSFILKGGLNPLLTKPIPAYLQVITNALKPGRLATTFIIFILLIISIILGNFTNYLFAILIWLIGFLGNLFLYNNISMIGFFSHSNFGLVKISSESNSIARNYTFSSFENNNLIASVLLILFPIAVVGYIVFQILKGNLYYFYNYIWYFLIYLVVMFVINVFMWKLGLRKYFAYN